MCHDHTAAAVTLAPKLVHSITVDTHQSDRTYMDSALIKISPIGDTIVQQLNVALPHVACHLKSKISHLVLESRNMVSRTLPQEKHRIGIIIVTCWLSNRYEKLLSSGVDSCRCRVMIENGTPLCPSRRKSRKSPQKSRASGGPEICSVAEECKVPEPHQSYRSLSSR